MKSDTIYGIIFVIVIAVAFYVVWMNRASEKIISAVIPISVAAVLGVLMAVFVFGGDSPTITKFPVTFFYRTSDHLPLAMPLRRPTLGFLFLPQLNQQHPDLMKDDTGGQTLYHHLLQRAIFDILASRYRGNWETEIIRFKTSIADETRFMPAAGAGTDFRRLSSAEIETALKGNRFAGGRMEHLQITLPPGTSVKVSPPTEKSGTLPESIVVFKNKFVTVTIQTQASEWGLAFGGYQVIMGHGSNYDPGISHATFLLTAKTEFNRLRTGHPDMQRYRTWASQLVAELQHDLDEQLLWQETKESYSFMQLERLGPINAQPAVLQPPQVNNP